MTANAPRRLSVVPNTQISLPANSFSYNAGLLTEGMVLATNNVKAGAPALFVGSRFIRQSHTNGCYMDRQKTVRRAAVKWVGRDDNIPCFVQPADDDATLLLYATADPMPQGLTLFGEFAAGILHTGSQIAFTGDYRQMLIAFTGEDNSADIFCPDGSVKRVVQMDGSLVLSTLSAAEQAGLRIELALNQIASGSPQGVEFAYRQLVVLMAYSAARDETIFDQVYDLLETAAKERKLSKAVMAFAVSALEQIQPEGVAYFRDLGKGPAVGAREGTKRKGAPKKKAAAKRKATPKGE